MNWDKPTFLILSDDEALKATLGGKLVEWGAEVALLEIGSAIPTSQEPIDVVLIDVRQKAVETLHYFDMIKTTMPFAETLIINRSGNISASMEGMRAGAGDELIVPLDTAILQRKMKTAYDRSRKRQKKRSKRSLFAVFGDSMSAATFAQAGEFETALEMLKSPPPDTKK